MCEYQTSYYLIINFMKDVFFNVKKIRLENIVVNSVFWCIPSFQSNNCYFRSEDGIKIHNSSLCFTSNTVKHKICCGIWRVFIEMIYSLTSRLYIFDVLSCLLDVINRPSTMHPVETLFIVIHIKTNVFSPYSSKITSFCF